MSNIVLRHGGEWRRSTHNYRIVSRFHDLAREHGSQAIWEPLAGILVTMAQEEKELDFPYEDWLHQAIQGEKRLYA